MEQLKFGRDKRGWITVRVPAQKPGQELCIWDLTIDGKKLQLVQQPATLKVYVDPDRTKFDEWESPANSGHRMLIGSPP